MELTNLNPNPNSTSPCMYPITGKSTELAKAKGQAQTAMLQWYKEAAGKETK